MCPRAEWNLGIIEKSAIEGQKQYHDDLEKGMRAHMKEHSTEFFVAGAPGDEAAAADDAEGDKENLTAAEEYALETRRKRQYQDYSALQGALDSVIAGFKAIFSGLSTAIESISDLLNLGDEGSRTVVLGLVIALLVISNIYTYVAYKPTSAELRRIRRLGGVSGGAGGDDINEAVRLLLQNANTGKAPAGHAVKDTPREEASDLLRILDEVEGRMERLRDAVKSSVSGEGSRAQDKVD